MMPKKTCFVITGFGVKSDPATGRDLDLDKTFENLIQPVFEEMDIECFRASEIIHSGIIDVPMYEWLFKADIVVADISTLNANALYELGVRHALRPCSTIVISEDELKYPFDVNHTIIECYEHLGKDIGVSEARRFKKTLKNKVQVILKSKNTDSPVYTYLPGLTAPKFSSKQIKKISERKTFEPTLSDLVNDAERLKDKGDYKTAKLSYKAALSYDKNNDFLIQRIALVTYKSELPNRLKSLRDAEKVLSVLNPETTTNTETLGLSGAINKRLFEETGKTDYLERSLEFYEKGFYIEGSYYNGVNVAYLYLLMANTVDNRLDAIGCISHAKRIYKKVIDSCVALIKSEGFEDRGDKHWIYQTLTQCYLVLGNERKIKTFTNKARKLSKGSFDLETFERHNVGALNELKKAIKKYKIR